LEVPAARILSIAFGSRTRIMASIPVIEWVRVISRRLNVLRTLTSGSHLRRRQESRATVVGRVTDSSSSVIPGASVEFTNLGAGVTVKTETNSERRAAFPMV